MMSVLAIHPFDNNNNNAGHGYELSKIGCAQSYCFYQQLNTSTKRKLEAPKQIVPNIPRQKIKAPKNSPLSPIRSQKCNKQIEPELLKRPYPLVATFSSPGKMQTNNKKKRHRKVSFDEKVVVVCTVFDDDEEEEVESTRRHSTGEAPIKTKLTKSLKEFKNRLLS